MDPISPSGDPYSYPRSPGTHIVGPWVIDNIVLYRDLLTGSQYTGNWASRVIRLLRTLPGLHGPHETRARPHRPWPQATRDHAGNSAKAALKQRV